MTIALVGWGTFNAATTGATNGSPTGSTGDCVLGLLGNKPFSSTPTQANYTQLNSQTNGIVANGNGLGSVRATVFRRSVVQGTTYSDVFGTTLGSPTMAQGVRLSKGFGYDWVIDAWGLSDSDETGTGVSATGAIAANDIVSGDTILISVVIKDDVPNHTAQSLTIPGCTVGAITWETKRTTTSGNDGAMYVGRAVITAGASTAGNATYTATSSVSGASGAAVNVVRLREKTSTPTDPSATMISDDEIEIAFGGIINATSYTIQRSLDGSTGWTTIYSGATYPHIDSGLDPGTTYYYRIRASGPGGDSDWTSVVNATTDAAPGSVPLKDVVVGGVIKSVSSASVIQGGAKKAFSSVSKIIGGAKKPVV